ncbi:hypothetical protein FOPG_15975 [Fusarium oxysporum f. sp. conglutinans race 2 54008]|uniref:Uncharacterized protein n=1 Tax=Fusarium oxysporum f. sp. conglutinans race 2 54008 TaxID=1089457 RepID=X0I3S2_FUSOX|nr:hypothetical protein FOPG_15975 [Fusarium oxysporum f. sp. conglutinans race 2 54008]KAK2469556.1 hypothetical protein H9L39_18827 [Fusarium oxysporum f. sp. albedinis]
MDRQHDAAFTQLKYSFSELCLADRAPAAERVLDIVRDLGWDVERVEGNRPAIVDDGVSIVTGESMLRAHFSSGLAHLTSASIELGRLGLRAQKDKCERIVQDCRNYSGGQSASNTTAA